MTVVGGWGGSFKSRVIAEMTNGKLFNGGRWVKKSGKLRYRC